MVHIHVLSPPKDSVRRARVLTWTTSSDNLLAKPLRAMQTSKRQHSKKPLSTVVNHIGLWQVKSSSSARYKVRRIARRSIVCSTSSYGCQTSTKDNGRVIFLVVCLLLV